MRDGLVLDPEDVKEALADYFGVSRDKVIKVGDLYVVIRDETVLRKRSRSHQTASGALFSSGWIIISSLFILRGKGEILWDRTGKHG